MYTYCKTAAVNNLNENEKNSHQLINIMKKTN